MSQPATPAAIGDIAGTLTRCLLRLMFLVRRYLSPTTSTTTVASGGWSRRQGRATSTPRAGSPTTPPQISSSQESASRIPLGRSCGVPWTADP